MAPGVPEKVAPHVPSKAAVRKARIQRPHKPTVKGERRIHQSRKPTISERLRDLRDGRWGPSSGGVDSPRDDRGSDSWACVLLHLITVRCFDVGDPRNDSWRWLHVQKRRDVTTLEGARSKHKEAQR